MNDRNFHIQTDSSDAKKGAKTFWKKVGIGALAFALAVLTVLVISLNR